MAATVTSAWKKPGAWALDSEEHEAELLEQKKEEDEITAKTLTLTANGGGEAADFPSLKAAVATKTKKKKPQTMSLSVFSSKPTQASYTSTRGLTPEDLLVLPTGPRQRSEEELDRSRLGGGFRSYGSSYDKPRYSNDDDSSNSRWGSSRGSDERGRREGFGNRDPLAPSRADEADDWGSMKKSVGSERRDRGFFGSSESKADELDSWVSNKSFVPSEGRRFDNSRERRVGFASTGAADAENWLKKKEDDGGRRFGSAGGSGGAFDSLRERRGGFDSSIIGGTDSDSWGKKREEGIGSGRPRLNLQPRTVPLGGDGQQNGSITAAKPRGLNPFGEARPREEVLKEKGQDWKEIDEKLKAAKFKEIEVPPTGMRGFRSSNGRGSTPDGLNERSWRKSDSADVHPPSSADAVEAVENGDVEAEDSRVCRK